MISYKEFCDHVKDHITDFLPEEYQQASVIVQKVEKNNGLVLQGLSIKKEEETIAPCIYLEQYYEEYSNGYGIKEVMREIGTVYMDYKSRENDISIPQNLTDYESVKDQLIAQVVNTWRNMDRIESIPHVDREDLSFIFKIMVDMDDQGRGTITINNELMKVWGITTEQLCADALENMKRIDPPEITSLAETLSRMGFSFPGMDTEIDEKHMMYIISNKSHLGGAAYMFTDELLSNLSDKLGSDLIVLPSSIHEVICISAENTEMMLLADMVKKINASEVAPEEQLSDNVYYYDAKSHEIMLGSEHERREAEEAKQSKAKETPEETEKLSNRRGGR